MEKNAAKLFSKIKKDFFITCEKIKFLKKILYYCSFLPETAQPRLDVFDNRDSVRLGGSRGG